MPRGKQYLFLDTRDTESVSSAFIVANCKWKSVLMYLSLEVAWLAYQRLTA